MALVLIPPTEASVYVDATPNPADRAQRLTAQAQLGAGLVRPFRRDEKSDFANLEGLPLIKACVGQILAMEGANPDNPNQQGELEWDPGRGSLLHLLRHRQNNETTAHMARVYVADAIARFEPRIRLRDARATRAKDDNGEEVVLVIRVLYDVMGVNQNSNQVLYSNVDQTVTLLGK